MLMAKSTAQFRSNATNNWRKWAKAAAAVAACRLHQSLVGYECYICRDQVLMLLFLVPCKWSIQFIH